MERVDVLVIGAGPAGMALAAACGQRGMSVGLLDPNPERRWVATYGMWSPELPADLPAATVAARAEGRAIALTEHRLGWEYVILDIDALRAHLADHSAGVTVYTGRAVGSPQRGVVSLADGSTLRASVVVDATGRSRPLDPNRSRRVPAEQTAYGVVLDEAAVAPLVAPGEALFMDWRADHGESGWPTFLYVVPLGGGAVLVEETSLARRPGLPLATLRRRLHARLAHHGITAPKEARTEKVSFPVDQTRHSGPGVVGFGAAAPLIHPASGFSVASSLHLAPRVACAFAEHLPADPDRALAAAQATVWPTAAKVIHRVRRIGLEALLRMPAAEVPGFFEQFFSLPDAHRWAYLTGRDDIGGTVAAMASLFRESNWRLRRHLVLPALMRALETNEELPAPPIRAN
ncbi:lycopene cyclase family protein [Mycolicibacterium rhodesiae]|uniref:Lycopene cyclase n=1 Tax=Mycolicibacterium rhodesiae TaxID=36814 RepID=A0A1X0J2F8_MYCRH|nr:lycopene cyclase family protein [Mycolicibacterium rhodesiae]MCV7348083.1 lycopene cyclase family protein [Mycolicibacterium rhodesiae]ORB56077.1 lycopene cyclase [Mycolicibacterium rhodesiae]